MCLSTISRIICLGIVFLLLGAYDQAVRAEDDQRTKKQGASELAGDGTDAARNAQRAATVAEVIATLDVRDLPKPKDAETSFVTPTTLHYKTAIDLDSAIISVADEFLKRGFLAGDTSRTRSATITIKQEDRPMTIWMMNSLEEPLTHVTMYHHQGIDISAIPRLKAAGPVDQRVNETYYTTEIGVREGQGLLRAQIRENEMEIARMSSSNGIAKIFTKDGITFVCQVDRSDSQEFEMTDEPNTKTTSVYISSFGNLAAAELPKPDDFEDHVQGYNAIFGSHKYITKLKPSVAVKQAAAELQRAGWKPVESIRESVSDKQRLLISNGVLIQIGAKGYGDQRTHVDYVVSMLAYDLPPNIDTRIVRVDSASPRIFFTTSANVSEVAEFYVEYLKAIGWEPSTERLTATSKEYRQLFQIDQSAAVVLNVQSKGPQTTWAELAPIGSNAMDSGLNVELDAPENELALKQAAEKMKSELDEAVSPETREEMMALAQTEIEAALKDIPPEHAAEIRKMIENNLGSVLNGALADLSESNPDMAETEMEDSPREDSVSPKREAPKDKLAADDFPVPDGAQRVTRDFEMITFGVDQIAQNAKSINKQLIELDWKPRGEQMVETDYAYLKFQKGTGTINVSLVLDDRRTPPVHVVIQGDGLWFADSNEFAGESADFGAEAEMEVDGREESFDSADDSFADDTDDDSPTEFEGLALPKGIDSQIKMSSQFRNETTTSIESDLKSMIEFFRTAASDGNWKTIDEKIGSKKAMLTLVGEQGEMLVNLQQYEGEIEIHLALRDTERAKKHGFFPQQGLGKLMLANASESKVTIVINGQTYKLEPLQGAEDPSGSIQLNVRPGRYNYTIKAAGREEQSDKLSVVIGGTWAVMVLPEQGHMAEQMY